MTAKILLVNFYRRGSV